MNLLDKLDLSRQQLKALSSEIGLCFNLQELNLRDNQLTSLPDEMRALVKLKILDLANNEELKELPEELEHLPALEFINLENTGIADQESIQNECRVRRDLTHLSFWKSRAQKEFDLGGIYDLPLEREEALIRWLIELEKGEVSAPLAECVCLIMEDLFKDQGFQEQFFAELDRRKSAERVFTEMYTLWQGWKADSPAVAAGVKKTLRLRKEISEWCEGCDDSVYLYYENLLREPLGLVSGTPLLSIGNEGRRSWIDRESLVRAVNR